MDYLLQFGNASRYGKRTLSQLGKGYSLSLSSSQNKLSRSDRKILVPIIPDCPYKAKRSDEEYRDANGGIPSEVHS